MASVKDYLFKTNEYNRPVELENAEAMYTLIIRLMLLEPGTIPSHPNMGIGLRSRYMFNSEDSINTLRSEIKRQMQRYLPELLCVEVSAELVKSALIIYINTESVTYGLSFSEKSGELKQLTLDDLKIK